MINNYLVELNTADSQSRTKSEDWISTLLGFLTLVSILYLVSCLPTRNVSPKKNSNQVSSASFLDTDHSDSKPIESDRNITIPAESIFAEQIPSKNKFNFRAAKIELRKIYKNHPIDFYCGCGMQRIFKDGYSILSVTDDCRIATRKDPNRSRRIEWEHIVAAGHFGSQLACWTKTNCQVNGRNLRGRKCCVKTDPAFNQMEGDMHNLRPVPGEINNDRGNFDFGIIPGEIRKYGSCDFEVDFRKKIAEPREEIRGDIARTYFYMEKQYGVKIQSNYKKLLIEWNLMDPPDDWERSRNLFIEKIQGNRNPFIQ
ncbi:endonuclease [Leptospira sp. GIMC2001]|uniref:endonuclease n=1 Tax=Leptospira sp. GIMC2001 TaxID=1513297 RepID=UPI00234B65E9|nr:endonuclease [Leptospira sp. GIMC2001]WCL51148.1 endonuclease [Leptospira sp. GIMC2001]